MVGWVSVLLGVWVGVACAQYDPNIAKTVLSLMDLGVSPCDDFYHFACGAWINQTVIPPDRSIVVRSFTSIEEHNTMVLKDILTSGLNLKITQLYKSCLNMDPINSAGFQPILFDLALVSAASDLPTAFQALASLNLRGIDSFFSFGPVIDSGDPLHNIAQFDQGGLGLPFPGLYTGSDPGTLKIQQEYQELMRTLHDLVGLPNTEQFTQLAYDFEASIAGFTISQDQLTNPFTTYNKMTSSEFLTLYPPFTTYFSEMQSLMDIPMDSVVVTVPSFFGNLSQLLSTSNSTSLQAYLLWSVLRTRAPLLSSPFRDAYFNFFGRILSGQQQPTPLDKQCVDVVDSSLGELLGQFFNEIAFPGDSKTKALEILSGIISAMNFDINNITWMDPTTQGKALTKLSMVTHLIGAPEDPDNYTDVRIDGDYFGNRLAAIEYGRTKSYRKIGQLTDKKAFDMTAPTVNAYYDPTKNQMVFMDGILQQPYFNVSYPPSMNYGGIGLIMGHELTHGFDDQGRLYDGNGLLINWWTPQTNQEFNNKVQCVIDQYSKFEVIPGVFVNGQLTQGENIADMGGMKNSFHAYSQVEDINAPSIVPGYTNGQLYFLSYAQTWCEKATDEHWRVSTQTDPHSPAIFRVLGPMMNLPAFADVWNCPVGSRMNNPANRCQVW
eukprot:TRINITY_DN22412_c0_g1_i1.p1 TRINITY_DN22412_c0_g1~~TRINITY_DN22412_c0_g1_i1.p1  ORF type:complete len:672 (+),score=139.33 TRINITY_DN22412_c0_g1_i1:30-2018(+)